jgi:hypothetical protein
MVNPELAKIQSLLHEHHRLLLISLKQDLERLQGKVLNPAEWFQILLGSAEYGWLKPLNSLISDIDALLEAKSISSVDLGILHHELERFFFKEDGDVTSFNYHYRKLFALFDSADRQSALERRGDSPRLAQNRSE